MHDYLRNNLGKVGLNSKARAGALTFLSLLASMGTVIVSNR